MRGPENAASPACEFVRNPEASPALSPARGPESRSLRSLGTRYGLCGVMGTLPVFQGPHRARQEREELTADSLQLTAQENESETMNDER